jgi:UDP-N-acetylmuramoylalanine--D-glutamate ligase
MIRASTFAGSRVAVFGLGASGLATVRALEDGGARVAAWDDSEPSRKAAEQTGCPVVDLASADWSGFAALLLAPGVPLTHPEPHWTVEKAHAAGVEVIGDVELFFRERAAIAPSSPVVAITGTNGKSTTTALIAHILSELGCDVQMGGNIGRAVLTLEPPAEGRVHVLELSSFQIDLTPGARPTVAILLNVTPDHIDRHGSVEHYAEVKERLVAKADAAAIGVEDEFTRAIAARRAATGALYPFAVERSTAVPPATFFANGPEIFSAEPFSRLASLEGIRSLRGDHNMQNALAALSALRALNDRLAAMGRPANLWRPEDIARALRSFPGLPHRMEEIGAAGPVVFINDSKATNADSTEKALASFPRAIYWILGGKAKDGGITTLERFFPRVARAYLIGEASDAFAATLEGKVPFERCGTLDVALAQAAADARSASDLERIVLLSPACASYDQYRNFEQRGDHFRTLVGAMPGVTLKAAARGAP